MGVPGRIRGVCALALALAWPTFAGGEPRDVVFDCPCRAEWTAGVGDEGRLTLEFGVRSHRATESGEIRLVSQRPGELPPSSSIRFYEWRSGVASAPSVGPVAGGVRLSGERRELRSVMPASGEAILVLMLEKVGSRAHQADPDPEWRVRDAIALWPAPAAADGRTEFVDILTDTDGDGVGDVNERLAGTSPTDEASRPEAPSTIDVLAIFDASFRSRYGGYPETRIHHMMTLTGALFADNGTNIRLRTVGLSEVALGEGGRPVEADRAEQKERHGADLSLMFHGCEVPDHCSGRSGWASGGGVELGGYWEGGRGRAATVVWSASALTAAHELGHNLGLAHSNRQGEVHGTFRWSRGHYIDLSRGTIMSYGAKILGGVFSDPGADCLGVPCGVPAEEPEGADAVRSLDLMRWQAAAHRASKPDTDGDGIVDAGDALPDDPREYVDADGDGIGDFADGDDDNDGVPDGEDAFPVDPEEWADADRDGIGDNADESVANLDPFRDPALRAAVEAALDKAPGDPITEADLLTLTRLTGPWRAGIVDLTGLELAANLEYLQLDGNNVEDLSPLADLSKLGILRLRDNAVSDLAPLADLPALWRLEVAGNLVSDLSPLADLPVLRNLDVSSNPVLDFMPLAQLSSLRFLIAVELGIADLAILSRLVELVGLWVSNNPVADLSALRQLTQLQSLYLDGTNVTDLSPLRQLAKLESLSVADTYVTDLSPLSALDLLTLDVSRTAMGLDDVLALPNSRQLVSLTMVELGIEDEDLGALSEFGQLDRLNLAANRISDLSPLGALRGLRNLNLTRNLISDIGPLVRQEIWDLEYGNTSLFAWDNPLEDASLREHIPKLQTWGLSVKVSPSPAVAFPDPVLRRLVSGSIAGGSVRLDSPITEATIRRLRRLDGFRAGVSDLTGLESAADLRHVFLGSNSVSDLSPLGVLHELAGLDLSDNRISDLSPLVGNPAFGNGDWVTLDGNPLSEESLNVHVPALLDRGVEVRVDNVGLALVAGGGPLRYETEAYFETRLGSGFSVSASSDDPSRASAEMADGVLVVTPGAGGGTATVRVAAVGADGAAATLSFAVSVGFARRAPLIPSASDVLGREGFVRVVNRGPAAEFEVVAVDDTGVRAPALTLGIGAGETVQFNSWDLETGNAGKGLRGASGRGAGDWRLEFRGPLQFDVLAYVRTPDGFRSAMHDTAPRTATGDHRVPIFNPAGGANPVSALRLINFGATDAEATVSGTDDRGETPGGTVRVAVPASSSLTLTAAQLEAGGAGLSGRLGDGAGRWRLRVVSDGDLAVMSLLSSSEGHLTNLSTAAPAPSEDDGVHHVPLFPSALDALGRQGLVRVINRSARRGEVRIRAFDDAGWTYEPLTLTLDAGRVGHFNSDDLERGNERSGLQGRTGPGTGDWRLELSSELDIEVLAYIESPSGFLTSMHDRVEGSGQRYEVVTFNAGSNASQVSRLRIVNPGSVPADVSVAGVDDAGDASEGAVRIEVPAGAARTLTSADLESGHGVRGRLGDGTGSWRLTVHSEQPILVMSLLSSPTGILTNVSTRPNGTAGGDAADSGEWNRIPGFPDGANPGDRAYTVGTAIDTLTLAEATGGNGTLTYSLSPGVPGLTFDTGTRQLAGAPGTPGAYSMTYTVTDEDGDTDSLEFAIEVRDEAGSFGVCQVGMTLSSGQSCTYPGTMDAFSVNARGRGSFLDRLAGIRIRIDNETINGRVYDFLASHQGDGVWRIDRVAGKM